MEPMEKRVMLMEAAGRLSWRETRWLINSLCQRRNTALRPYPELCGGSVFDIAEGVI